MMRCVKKAAVVIMLTLAFCAGSASAKKPTPAEVTAYQCAVTPHSNDANPVCQHIPGFWNRWAGRPTPPRWDPCRADTRVGLIYGQPCTPRSVSVAGWCTLHFDHRIGGWDMCTGPYTVP